MRLKSAFDDLTTTTLQAVGGLWASLEYLAGLRGQDGSYLHWGLGRVHGENAAQDALKTAHKSALSKVLRMPIRDLEGDVERASQSQGLAPAAYVKKLSDCKSELLPAKPPAASDRHLSSVLSALSALYKNRRGATRPDA